MSAPSRNHAFSTFRVPRAARAVLPDPLGEQLGGLLDLAVVAGRRILALYGMDVPVLLKEDESPVTPADEAAHACILEGLGSMLPDVPVVSEEGGLPDPGERAAWPAYFLVDPLDGTKGFIRRNGQFTVNIAYMVDHRPVLGIIHVPLQGTTYLGVIGGGAYKADVGPLQPIRTRKRPAATGPVVLQSNVERTPRLDAFMEGVPHTRIRAGSSLKFCLLAEGSAQIFPCLHPTWEWDTAAGHALLEAAGGSVLGVDGEPFLYGKADLLNGWFVARA